MAMAWLSQQLESITGNLMDMLMKFNQEFQSGCQIQETMLAGFAPTKDMSLNQLMGEMGDRLGSGMNMLGDQFRNVLSRTEDRAESNIDPEKVNRGLLRAYANSDDAFIHRNWIWEIMRQSNLTTGGNSATPYDLATDVISLTGVSQQCWVAEGITDCLTRTEAENLPADQAGSAKVEYRAVLPPLEYRDFVVGQTRPDGLQERVLKQLVCEDASDDPPCLLMRTTDRTTPLKGMQQLVFEVFLGANNNPGQGIIGRSALNEEPTAFELRMLSASGQYGRMLMEIRKLHGEQVARNVASANTKGLANEIAFGLLMDMLGEIDTSISSLDQGAPVQSLTAARELLSRRILQIQDEYRLIAEEEATVKAMEDMRRYLRNSTPRTEG